MKAQALRCNVKQRISVVGLSRRAWRDLLDNTANSTTRVDERSTPKKPQGLNTR